MLTFFQHFLIGKMEEETHSDEEVVDQEQPESEHSDVTPNPDSSEPMEEGTRDETSDDALPESDSDASLESSETPDIAEESPSEGTPESDEAQEVEVASEVDETSESVENFEVEATSEVEVMSDTEDVSEVDQAPETGENTR